MGTALGRLGERWMRGLGTVHPVQGNSAERMAAGDPRPSVEERYPSFAMYRSGVMRAIDDLVRDRFMLCEDAGTVYARLLQAGLAAGVPPSQGNSYAAGNGTGMPRQERLK